MDEIKRFPVTVEDGNIYLKTSDTFEKFLLKLEENQLDIHSLLIKIKVESFRGKKYVEKNDAEYQIMEFPLSDNIEAEKLVTEDLPSKLGNVQLCRLCGTYAANSIEICSEKDEIAQKINYFLPITILKSSNTSVHICEKCATKINVFSEFITQCLENEPQLTNEETVKTAVEVKKDPKFVNSYGNVPPLQTNDSVNFENDLNSDNDTNLDLDNIFNEAISLNLESESILSDITILNLEADAILNEFSISNTECQNILNETTPLPLEISMPVCGIFKPSYELQKPVAESLESNGKILKSLSAASEEICEKSKTPEKTKPIVNRELEIQCTKIEVEKLSLKSKKKRTSKLEIRKSKKQRKETDDHFENEKKDFKCISCSVSLSSQEQLSFHLKRHETGSLEEFSCAKCKVDFSTEEELWKHCESNCLPRKEAQTPDLIARNELTCNICKDIFTLKERYDFHVQLHENGEFDTFKCFECEKIFETETVLWDHHQTAHKHFTCFNCKKSFRKKASLKFHLKTTHHSDQEIKIANLPKSKLMITCAKCGARYRRKERYEFHVKRHEFRQIDVFTCMECEKEFTNENVLWDHYQYTHRKTKRFNCLTCGKGFPRQLLLTKHQLKFKHKGRKAINVGSKIKKISAVDKNGIKPPKGDTVQPKSLNCVLCGETVSKISKFDPESLNDAVTCDKCETPGLSLKIDSKGVSVISRRQHHCNLCKKHFSTKDRLEYHIMRHSEKMDEFICSTCGKKLSTEQALFEHHLFVHKGVRPHVCELCGKSYQFRTRLNEHMRSHSGERPFACDACGQGFMTNNSLRSHLKTHLNDKKFLCQLCPKLFRRQQDLNQHIERHWKIDKTLSLSGAFHCENCSEFFPTIRALKVHLKEQHGIENTDLTDLKPWLECEECHEKFKHQLSLKSHKQKAHQRKPKMIYRCDKCVIIYKTARLLANHMNNIHGGEKRFKCAQCGKEYNQSKSLQNHILIHTGEKPFSCQICEMSFRTKESRDYHHRKHTGEKPYKCPKCEETFATAGQRREHRKKVHEDGNQLPCPQCGKICFGERGIRSHLSIHATEKPKISASH